MGSTPPSVVQAVRSNIDSEASINILDFCIPNLSKPF